MTLCTLIEAMELVEAFNVTADTIASGDGGHGFIEAFVAGLDVEGAQALLEVQIAALGRPIAPESITVQPDTTDCGMDCAHIIIKTEG